MSSPWASAGGSALQCAAHAAGAAAAVAELETGDGHDLDAVVAQALVGVDVALVGDHHPGGDRQHVVAVVPLLPGGGHLVAAGLEGADARQLQHPGQGGEQLLLRFHLEVSRMNIWLGSGGSTNVVGWKLAPTSPSGENGRSSGMTPPIR